MNTTMNTHMASTGRPAGTNKPAGDLELCILSVLHENEKRGDTCMKKQALYLRCAGKKDTVTPEAFEAALQSLAAKKAVVIENDDCYIAATWRQEQSVTKRVASLLESNFLECGLAESTAAPFLTGLVQEQVDAVSMALNHRISVITGGAGTGKTTLIRALINCHRATPHGGNIVLCAPTGKAARCITQSTGFTARTIHSALGKGPEEDFGSPIVWEYVDLIIVDEASMLPLNLLAGLLESMWSRCRIVFIGDPNQLPAVGVGDVLRDLLTMGVPHIHLVENHRQRKDAAALLYNITNFAELGTAQELCFDDSFEFRETAERDAFHVLVEEAALHYLAGDSVQVITAFNLSTPCSVANLNRAIKERVNPCKARTTRIIIGGYGYDDGDRVMILKNDKARHISNGDIGTIHILEGGSPYLFTIVFPDGRAPQWRRNEGPELTLAYAITVHKSQGSEYDMVLMPILENQSHMLDRNFFYTAISRAKNHTILIGEKQAMASAIQRKPRERNSNLCRKVDLTREAYRTIVGKSS